MTLPEGVELRALSPRPDARGTLVELFRASEVPFAAVQWNLVDSRAGVLRGVHVHVRHWDYLLLVSGRASIGLRDVRPGKDPVAACVELDGARREALVIPPGVAHGFFFHVPSVHLYAVSHYWDPADELGCHWADPELGIPWRIEPRELSARDAGAPSLRVMIEELARAS